MRLSVRAEYAIRALMVLCECQEGEVVRIQAISERQNIPKRFLEQILNDLRAAGFVESRRGVSGGYRLARPPQQITLADLVHHIQGLLPSGSLPDARLPGRSVRSDEVVVVIQNVLAEVRAAMRTVLERITLADLYERARQLRAGAGGGTDYVI